MGDRVLGINGQSLQGKRVSEAMQMLQTAGDTVALKIARYVEPPFPYQLAHHRGYAPMLHRGIVNSTGFQDNYVLHDRASLDSVVFRMLHLIICELV